LQLTDAMITALAFHPDGRLLASVGADRKLRIWDAESGKVLLELAGMPDNPWNGKPTSKP
jgi:WD40 repeat protein